MSEDQEDSVEVGGSLVPYAFYVVAMADYGLGKAGVIDLTGFAYSGFLIGSIGVLINMIHSKVSQKSLIDKVGWFLLLAVICYMAYFSFSTNSMAGETPEVRLVKTGTIDYCPSITVEQLIKRRFSKPQWVSFVGKSNKKFVNVTGETVLDRKVGDGLIQFSVTDDNSAFKVEAFAFKGEPKDTNVISSFLTGACPNKKEAKKETGPYKIYNDYMFGTPRNQIALLKGAYNCEQETQIQGSICLDGQSFAGFDADLIFNFYTGKLTSIMLAMHYSLDMHHKIIAVLSKKFGLYGLKSGNKMFDVFENRFNPEMQADLQKFEENALKSTEDLTYIYLSHVRTLKESEAANITNISELIASLPEQMREIDIILSEDENREVTYLVNFTVPKAVQAMIKNNVNAASQAPQEDF